MAVQSITQYGNREWTTLIETISLNGRKIRPWIIFNAQRKRIVWSDAYPEAHITISENGWTNNEICLWYFEDCFNPETTPSGSDRWRMLLLDGHVSHISTKTVQYCISQKIILLCLPPHTTHILQPLDIGIFRLLGQCFRYNIHSITEWCGGYQIDKCDFLEQLRKAREQAITPYNIRKAWERAGLSPFNPKVILELYPQEKPPEAP